MTLALAMVADGGSVIAADRQQTEGILKADQGKISATWVGGLGSIAISGAGNGPYLDAISDELRNWFRSEEALSDNEQLERALRTKHEAFYTRYVLPFAHYADYDRPEYELLVVGSTRQSFDTIWSSHKLVVNKESFFGAVGIGATTARALLTKLYVPTLPLGIAINLGAYIVHHVKRTVDLVGLETDILALRDHMPFFVSKDQILDMETQFRAYEKLERKNLFYCLGGHLAHEGLTMRDPIDRQQREKEIRQFFEQLNEDRFKAGVLPF